MSKTYRRNQEHRPRDYRRVILHTPPDMHGYGEDILMTRDELDAHLSKTPLRSDDGEWVEEYTEE